MPTPVLTRRDAIGIVGLGLVSVSGCLQIFGGSRYRPGAIVVKNNSDRAHQLSVTFYRFEQNLWVERGETPTFQNPDIPTAEPEVKRSFDFDVEPDERTVKRSAITDPLCGAVTMVEVELSAGGRYTTHFVSMCDNSAPEGTSNVQLNIFITDSNALAVNVYTDRPGAA